MTQDIHHLEGFLFAHRSDNETRTPIAALLYSKEKANLAFFVFGGDQELARAVNEGLMPAAALIAQVAIEEAYLLSRHNPDEKMFEETIRLVCKEAAKHADIEIHGPLPAGESRSEEEFRGRLREFSSACQLFAAKLSKLSDSAKVAP